MIDFTGIFLMNLIRNRIDLIINHEKYQENDFNSDDIVKTLVEHKLLIHYADIIIQKQLLITEEKKIKLLLFKEKSKRAKYINFLSNIVHIFNNNNIKFIIYKGYALESLIYGEMKRTYADVDIVLENFSDFSFAREILYKNFEVVLDTSLNDTVLLGEYKIEIIRDGIIYCVEFKTPYHFLFNCQKNLIEQKIKGVKYYTFSLEVTLLNMVIYVYNFIENMYYIQYANKFILQYIVDLYEFIVKFRYNINWNYFIKLINSNDYSYMLVSVINVITDVYNTNDIKQYLVERNIFDDQFNTNTSFYSLINKFIHKDDVIELYRNYLKGDYFLKYNTNYYLNKVITPTYSINNSNIILNTSKYCAKLIIENIDIKKNYIFHIQLFYYDIYGEFVEPYKSILLRYENEQIILTGAFLERGPLLFDNSIEQNATKFERGEIIIEKENSKIILNIDYNLLDIDINKKIGINYILYELNDNRLKPIYLLNQFWKNPLIINY